MNMDEQKYPTERKLCGIYTRVIRDGKSASLCFTDLTKEEQEAYLQTLSENEAKQMCLVLAKMLRDIGDLFNLIYVEPEMEVMTE